MGLLVQVSGSGTCSQQGLGMCSPFNDECDKKCKALHSDGQGSCDSQFNLCTCSYNCPAPSPPSPPQPCTTGLGLCTNECSEDCCKAKCASGYNQGVGECDSIAGYRLCNCVYVC